MLGRHFLTLRGLAEACAAETGTPVRAELGAPELARLTRQCAEGIAMLGPLVAEQPGAAAALAATLRDLRDAGVPPAALPPSLHPLRTLYERCERALARLEAQGLFDRIGLFRLAQRGAADWVRRLGFRQLDLHGATELVGSAGDLIDALTDVLRVRVHQPDWGDDYTRELRQSSPWRFSFEPEPVLERPALPRGGKIPENVLRCHQTGDPRQELELVAREILRHLELGASPSGICVVARTLDPYAPWLNSVFRRYQIPFTSSLSESVLRSPFVRARLHLARTLVRNLEREPVLELLRCPRLRTTARTPRDLPQLAECLARQGRVLRGTQDWLHALDDASSLLYRERRTPDPGQLEQLRQTIYRLDEERTRWSHATSWQALAAGLDAATERWLRAPESAEENDLDALALALLQRLARWDQIDSVLGSGAGVSPEEFVSAFERELRDTRHRPAQPDEGGVRVLDALQARAVPCEHLFLLGLNHGSWPLEPREDPFLPTPLRQELRQKTGRPVPVQREAEDRFLLGLLLSQAQHSVTLTWHTRDAAGRERASSMYLHELPYVEAGSSALRRCGTPPEPRSQEFLSASDALVQAALTYGPRQSLKLLPALATQLTEEPAMSLAPGLELLVTLEARSSPILDYDGWVGADAVNSAGPFSPSFIDQLGQCPQRALFGRLLRVPEFDTPPLHALGPREAGTVVHRILRRIYDGLFEQGYLGQSRGAEAALAQARAALPKAIAEEARDLCKHLVRRYPTLWDGLQRQIRVAIEDFIQRDLDQLLPAGLTSLRVEEEVSFTRRSAGAELQVRGTADRILQLSSGEVRVSDYKTRRDTRNLLRPSWIRKGIALQIPLYLLAVGEKHPDGNVVGEALAVPLRPERDRDGRREKRTLLSLEDAAEQALPAIDVLTRLLHAGAFPFRRDAHCSHCAYVVACRKAHPPSEERVRSAAPFREYFELHGDPD